MRSSTLQSIAEGLLYAEADVGFLGATIQTRMVVARLPDDRLWVYSPLPLTDVLAAELEALGRVAYVLSPNKIHNQGLAGFHERYPEAELWASPGLPERRPDLPFTGVLSDAPEASWADVLDQRLTAGNCFFEEVVCLHRASRTLIVADLVETLCEETIPSAFARSASRLGRIFGRPLPSPEFRAYTVDAEAARARLEEIDAWPFERILMAHGEIVTDDAHGVFRRLIDHLHGEVSRRSVWRERLYTAMSRYQ